MTSETGGSLHTGGSTTYEATRERMAMELGRTPTQSEVFVRTYTRKEDRLWVAKRSEDANDASLEELKMLQKERHAIIDAVWTRIAGVYPRLFGDPDDDDTASSPPDLREQVTLLNRDISQQAEAHAQRVAVVEAICAEKTQSREFSELRKAYSDIYSFLTQMRSSGSYAATIPDMPPRCLHHRRCLSLDPRAKFGAKVAGKSVRNEKIATKPRRLKLEPMRMHHGLGRGMPKWRIRHLCLPVPMGWMGKNGIKSVTAIRTPLLARVRALRNGFNMVLRYMSCGPSDSRFHRVLSTSSQFSRVSRTRIEKSGAPRLEKRRTLEP
ncbi:hypothetical protein PIB30_059633 [Stylosanthes scabra]|uniref:Uncharacterized protein n=1 Tax=Stylosanthes scabra TaxID=79078 RepID=A0ABU6VMB0_9FABA|nr:hypothetical protein [Stylosanthes scabra]